MEELIQNFMIVTRPQIPSGEVYFEAENQKVIRLYVVPKVEGFPPTKIRPSFCN